MTPVQKNIVILIRKIAKEIRIDGTSNVYKLLYMAARDLEKYYNGGQK